MKFFLLLLASVFIALGWLLPIHYRPWVTFSSELASFGAALAFFGVSLKQEIKIPKPQLLMLPVLAIPLFQWVFGLITDFSVAFLSFSYMFMFWLMMVCGYSLSSISEQRERLMQGLSLLLLSIALISSLIAIV